MRTFARRIMSCIKAVVTANDLMLANAHKEFDAWRKSQLVTSKGKAKSLFRWALKHYSTTIPRKSRDP